MRRNYRRSRWGIFPVVRAFGDNAYEVAFLHEVEMHLGFNTQDLSSFWKDHVPLIALPLDPSRPALLAIDWVDIVMEKLEIRRVFIAIS